jgi:lipopolysaccharide/colanic/teichoic acid biosynthesis glycosyltransferase
MDADRRLLSTSPSGALAKRAEDLVLALLLLPLAVPAMLVIAALVRLDSPGPVLFSQRREGFHDQPITVHKFRTMRVECTDREGARQEQDHDPRVTRLGRILRRTRLDELPQLFDVLRGRMSLVGPRPYPSGMRIDHGSAHRVLAQYARRWAVKPGITGWAQVNGQAGPVLTEEALRRRIAYDLFYIDHWSVAFDLRILWRTAAMVLRQAWGRGR